MCTYTFTFDDKLMDKLKPQFSSDEKMVHWLQKELETIVIRHTKVSKPNSKTCSKKEFLAKLKELKNDKNGFLKLVDILPPSKYSAEELLNEYYEEKYGI